MWYLRCDRGRQWWEYNAPSPSDSEQIASARSDLEDARTRFSSNRSKQRHSSDTPLRILAKHGLLAASPDQPAPPAPRTATDDPVADSLRRGISFFSGLQMDDGHFPGDYGGPLFLLPGLIIVCYFTGTQFPTPQHGAEMTRYFYNQQREDGGWGLHIEKSSTMFGTVLSYVALRLLGEPAGGDDMELPMSRARKWILDHGGAVGTPSWGKFYLSVLGLYSWEGINPLTPEMWLLPYALPFHPARYWCHCRMVYLPMSYVYGKRATMPENALIRSIRQEIYTSRFEDINWDAQRNCVCPEDEYVKRPKLQQYMWDALMWYEKYPSKWLREKALRETLEQIKAEDRNTKFICIGPVNKAINMLANYVDDPSGEHFRKHQERVKDYLWVAEDGMKMNGYNGVQLWDTAFAVQAVVETGSIATDFKKVLLNAYKYIDICQVREDVPDRHRFYRHISNGAWPFSTVDHGWPIADCSSEGLKATLALNKMLSAEVAVNRISDDRLFDCVNVILSFWNIDSGGWATYELTRGPRWLELLNPSEVFHSIMIDYTWIECTSACITALTCFQRVYPDHRAPEIDLVLRKGLECLKRLQREDGSWYGNWGVCFTYAGFFGVEALVLTGHTLENSPHLRKACEFFASKQRSDGSWGEDYRSSQDMVYSQADEGQVVHTAWGLLSLCKAKWPEGERMDRAAKWLMDIQDEDGDWPQQNIVGVFSANCMISYSNYRSIFPIWALGVYRRTVLGKD